MSKSSSHWYARYTGDIQRKTSHLSLQQFGVYDRLLDWYYSNEKPLPASWVQMHRICSAVAPDEQADVQTVVEQFFTLEDDGWHNKKADEELEKRQLISGKRREAQAERERRRGANAPSNAGANGGANAPSNAHTTTTTTTVNTDVLTITPLPPEAGGVEVVKDRPARSEVIDLPDWMQNDPQVMTAFAAFLQCRKDMGNPVKSAYAINRHIGSLVRLQAEGHSPLSCINLAIERGWKAFYPPNGQQGKDAAKTAMSKADQIIARRNSEGSKKLTAEGGIVVPMVTGVQDRGEKLTQNEPVDNGGHLKVGG